MALGFRKLHPHFVAEVSGVQVRAARDRETLDEIRAGMDEHAVLVFHDQALTDAEHLAFAQRLDRELHSGTGSRVIQDNRFGNEALADISNLDVHGELMKAGDRRREYGPGNRFWHTDASFNDPPALYSMLPRRAIPRAAPAPAFAALLAPY